MIAMKRKMSLSSALLITAIGFILEILIYKYLGISALFVILILTFIIAFCIQYPKSSFILFLIIIGCVCPPLGIVILVLMATGGK